MNVHFLQEKPGFAAIILDLENAPEDKTYTLALRRSSDGYYLAQGGCDWTAQTQSLELPFQKIDTSLVFQLGPEYVNYMEPMNHQVTLYADGEPMGNGRIKIDSVQTQAIAGSGAMQVQPGREAQTAEVQPEIAEESEPVAASTEDSVPPQEEPINMPKPATAAPKSSNLPLIIALLVFLLGVGGGVGYYFYTKSGSDTVASADDEKAAETKKKAEEAAAEAEKKRLEEERAAAEAAKKADEEKAAAARKAAEEAAAQSRTQTTVVQGAGSGTPESITVRARARTFFASQEKTPQGAYDLTRELEASTQEEQDAVFRLLYYAANGDYKPAFIPYARCLDPTTSAWGSIGKDPVVAWEFYNKSGSSEGTAAAQQVLEWTKQQATTSNKAKEWLRHMK